MSLTKKFFKKRISLSPPGGDHQPSLMDTRYVYQKRSLEDFKRWKIILKQLEHIQVNPLFISSNISLEAESGEDHFWIIQKRLDTENDSNSYQNPCSVDWEETSYKKKLIEAENLVWDNLKESLQGLHELELTSDTFKLLPNNRTMFFNSSPSYTTALAKSIFPLPVLPEEPKSSLVFSHGNPSISNLILHKDNYYLIDWEHIGAFPEFIDWGMIIVFLMLYSDEDPEIVWDYKSDEIQKELNFSETEWKIAIIWTLVRVAVAPINKLNSDKYQHLIMRLVKEL